MDYGIEEPMGKGARLPTPLRQAGLKAVFTIYRGGKRLKPRSALRRDRKSLCLTAGGQALFETLSEVIKSMATELSPRTRPPDEQVFTSPPWSSAEVWKGLALAMGLAFLGPFVWVFIAPRDLATEIAAFITLGEAIAVPVVWFIGPKKHGASWTALGFRPARLQQFLFGCSLLIAMFVFNYLFSLFLLLFDTSIQPGLNAMVADARFPLWLIAASVLVAPISEEILFRGFVFGGFEAKYGWKKAAFFSALIFALLHFQPTAFLPLLVIGFLLCFLYYRTNSLWPAVLVHASMNLFAVLGALLLTRLEGML